MESSTNGQTTSERRIPKPWVVLAIVAAVCLVTLAASTARTGASAPGVPAVSGMVWPEGISGDFATAVVLPTFTASRDINS